jgi:hypothetical protein
MKSFFTVKKNISNRKKVKTIHFDDDVKTIEFTIKKDKENSNNNNIQSKVVKPRQDINTVLNAIVENKENQKNTIVNAVINQDIVNTVIVENKENQKNTIVNAVINPNHTLVEENQNDTIVNRVINQNHTIVEENQNDTIVNRVINQDKIQDSNRTENPLKRKIIDPPLLIDPKSRVFSTVSHIPAHIKYKHLTRSKTELMLPSDYESLFIIFNALETVVNYLRSKDTACIFHKVQKTVESHANRTFTLNHLAQIVYIYPDAYKLSSSVCFINEIKTFSIAIELKQDLLKNEFVRNLSKESQNLKNGPKLATLKSVGEDKELLASIQQFVKQIPIRRQVFKKLLVQRTRDFHNVYILLI